MNARFQVGDLEIIGAMTPPTSNASFNRANLVARAAGGVIVHIRAYTSDGSAEGPSLTEEDWAALLTTEQALALPHPVRLVAGAALWVLRPRLPRRERALHDLRACGVLLHEHLVCHEDAWLCLVDESRLAANDLRDRWRQEALDAARMLGWSGQWPRAQTEAENAHAFSRGLDPEVLALLVLAYERSGRDARAKGILTMARRSRGEDFASQISERLALLRRDLEDPPATVRVTSRSVRRELSPFAQMYRTAERGKKQSLRVFSPMEAVAV